MSAGKVAPWSLQLEPARPANPYWRSGRIMCGPVLVAEVSATERNLTGGPGHGVESLQLMTAAPAMRAALQMVYDELGRHSRWHVSTLRLEVIRPLLESYDAEASAAGLAKLTKGK